MISVRLDNVSVSFFLLEQNRGANLLDPIGLDAALMDMLDYYQLLSLVIEDNSRDCGHYPPVRSRTGSELSGPSLLRPIPRDRPRRISLCVDSEEERSSEQSSSADAKDKQTRN